ncbi:MULTISPECIES: hypothetical protein [unclassified Streptomyces]|uniref:Uncharacterized protein n=1 Tax=Streptomyces sp. NBC_00060 TaxID=2975636 RepID=A0AAU2H8B1_9ACTN
MTPTLPYEAPTSDSVLLSFNGRVLEVFGYVDAARYHIWEEPRLAFKSGRFRRLTITVKSGRQHTMPYDAHLLPGLQGLADLLARSVSEKRQP